MALKVARSGIKVPKENSPREYITDSVPVDVPDTFYYQKQIADGDLIDPPAAAVKGGE